MIKINIMTIFTIDIITYSSRMAYFLFIEPMRPDEKYKSNYTRMCYKHIPEYAEQSKKCTWDFMYCKYQSNEEYRQKRILSATKYNLKKKKKFNNYNLFFKL